MKGSGNCKKNERVAIWSSRGLKLSFAESHPRKLFMKGSDKATVERPFFPTIEEIDWFVRLLLVIAERATVVRSSQQSNAPRAGKKKTRIMCLFLLLRQATHPFRSNPLVLRRRRKKRVYAGIHPRTLSYLLALMSLETAGTRMERSPSRMGNLQW